MFQSTGVEVTPLSGAYDCVRKLAASSPPPASLASCISNWLLYPNLSSALGSNRKNDDDKVLKFDNVKGPEATDTLFGLNVVSGISVMAEKDAVK